MNIEAILALRYDPDKPCGKRLTTDDFKPLFYGGIENRMLNLLADTLPHHKHISLLLSGGVDSRFTLEMFRVFRPETKITAVCLGFNDKSDENKKALELAYEYDIDCVSIIKDTILDDLPKLVGIVNQPRWNVYQYYAYQKCPTDIIYTGDGSDELWAGYTWRYKAMQDHDGDETVYLLTHKMDWVEDQELLIPTNWAKIMPPISTGLSPVDRALMADYNGKLLCDYIPTGKALSRSLGKTVQSIFLMPEMIHLATHTHHSLKYDGQYGKLPLQNIMGTRIPKKGFSPPLEQIWEREGRRLYRDTIHCDSKIIRDGIINPLWIAKHPEPEDRRYINKMLQLVALEMWYQGVSS